MKAGKTANDYRQSPWAHSPGPSHDESKHQEYKKLQVETVQGATEHQEYPKHVKDAYGNTYTVRNEEHEASVLAAMGKES